MERETTVAAATMFMSILSADASRLLVLRWRVGASAAQCASARGATSSLEQLLRLGRCRHGVGPSGVEREMRDQLDELLLGHAVLDRAREVEGHLLGLAGRDERRAGNEAPV